MTDLLPREENLDEKGAVAFKATVLQYQSIRKAHSSSHIWKFAVPQDTVDTYEYFARAELPGHY